jgi:hypothetical protein
MTANHITANRLQFADWDAAQEYYFDQRLTDGLPIVPPTEDRVQAMLDYVGLTSDQVIGVESIRKKRFTAAKVAINAVMAGCRPEYFPAVVAAVAACCQREHNLHASSTSTNGATTLVLVSGPYAKEIGMNTGTGLMGNGNRANATIGRAVNLVKANFYGSTPQEMDNSTLGHPGDYSFCFAENLEVSPWPSLAAEKGFGGNASTVTVFAANAPLQVSIYGSKAPETFLTAAAHAMTGLGHSLPEVLVVISPEVMAYVAEAGWSRRQIQEFLYQKARLPAREWLAWQRVDHPAAIADPERLMGCVAAPDRITIVPGGGAAGAFISVIAAWGSSRSVTRKIETRR